MIFGVICSINTMVVGNGIEKVYCRFLQQKKNYVLKATTSLKVVIYLLLCFATS
jgi:hypothetical protein